MGVVCSSIDPNTKKILELKNKYPQYHELQADSIKKHKDAVSIIKGLEIKLCDHLKMFEKYKNEIKITKPDLYDALFVKVPKDLKQPDIKVKDIFPDDETKFLFFFNKRNFNSITMTNCFILFPRFCRQYYPKFESCDSNLTKITITASTLIFEKEKPEPYERLRNVKHLDLSYNNIETINENIKKLAKLETLILKRNSISMLPTTLYEMEHLTEIDLTDNKLTKVPTLRFEKIKKLNLNMNMIDNFEYSSQITDPPLEYLYLAQNMFKFIPSDIKKFTNLKHVALDGNKITEIIYSNIADIKFSLKISLSQNSIKNRDLYAKNFKNDIFEIEKVNHEITPLSAEKLLSEGQEDQKVTVTSNSNNKGTEPNKETTKDLPRFRFVLEREDNTEENKKVDIKEENEKAENEKYIKIEKIEKAENEIKEKAKSTLKLESILKNKDPIDKNKTPNTSTNLKFKSEKYFNDGNILNLSPKNKTPPDTTPEKKTNQPAVNDREKTMDKIIQPEKLANPQHPFELMIAKKLDECFLIIARDYTDSNMDEFKERIIRAKKEIILTELQNMIERKQTADIAKFNDFELKYQMKICNIAISKYNESKVTGIKPDLNEEEKIIYEILVKTKLPTNKEIETYRDSVREKDNSLIMNKSTTKDSSSNRKLVKHDEKKKGLDNLMFINKLKNMLTVSKIRLYLQYIGNIDVNLKKYFEKLIDENDKNTIILLITELKLFLKDLMLYYKNNSNDFLEIKYEHKIPLTGNVIHKIFKDPVTVKILFCLGLYNFKFKKVEIAEFKINHEFDEKYRLLENFLGRLIKVMRTDNMEVQVFD